MTAPSALETAATADAPAELTDGYHLVVDALKTGGLTLASLVHPWSIGIIAGTMMTPHPPR